MSPSDLEDEEENGPLEHFERDLDLLLRDLPSPPPPPRPLQLPHQGNSGGRAFFDIQRSGSAPPTVEGSMSAARGLLGRPGVREVAAAGVSYEEQIRSHPAYLPYHYSDESRNPRLPPPAIPREGWRVPQRLGPGAKPPHVDGVLGDWRKGEVMGEGDGGSNSLFSLQSGVSVARDRDRDLRMMAGVPRNSIQPETAEWDDRGDNGSTGFELGERRRSFADVLQEELSQPTALPSHMSRSTRRNSFGNFVDPVCMSNGNMKQIQKPESVDTSLSPAISSHLIRMRSLGSPASHSLASGLGLPRSTTPDPQLVRRSPSPCLPPIGAKSNTASNDCAKSMANHGDIAVALSGMNLTEKASGENHGEDRHHQEFTGQSNFLLNALNDQKHYPQQNVNCSPGTETGSPSDPALPTLACKDSFKKNGILSDNNLSMFSVNGQGYLPTGLSSRYKFATESFSRPTGSSSLYDKMELPNMGYAGTNTKSFTNEKYTETTNRIDSDGQYHERSGNQVGQAFQVPPLDPLHGQFVQRANSTAQPAFNFNGHALGRSYTDIPHSDISYQKAYVGGLIAQQELQYGMPFHGKSTGMNHGFRGNAAYGPGLPYPTNSLSSAITSSRSAGNPPRLDEWLLGYPLLTKNPRSGSLGPRAVENGIRETGFGSSFLEEFKNNKARSFELSEIVGHVVEFSTDQYGSRFIQQKLEIASVEEKNDIFPEILPHAHALMTDVFGNYVIQKFFEHGTKSQRTELAKQLRGHVLALSLQMYGCRVIQKALEVVDEDEQTQMVSELDGSVIKCVRDQNGNHVIQKCIECVPQEKIQFIIATFYGQVVVLSTHPYGCRVIQRVLENCDEKTQSVIMEEILQSVTTLALDQYGNYVVQHVLQHGKPEERSAIISLLLGQIVAMSQQKFASNVVEKCLTYGTAEERQLLINEMLGSTDENEPLQAMMKDQFGNYVVQKVLDLCDDHNRELILSRIKIHLTVLKRFTYGKHIVSRVEKLVTNEERRMGISSYSS